MYKWKIYVSFEFPFIMLQPKDVALNPPPITRKPSKTQMPMIKQTALKLRQQKCGL